MENHKWAPPGIYQLAMNMYLGTDSSNDKGGWFSSSYRSIIQGGPFKSRCPMGEGLRIYTKGNYQRMRLGLLGAGSKKNYDSGGTAPTGMTGGPKIYALKGQRGRAGVSTCSMALDLFVTEDLELSIFCLRER